MTMGNSRTRVAIAFALVIMASLRFQALAWLLPLLSLVVGLVAAREMHNMAILKRVRSTPAITMPATALLVLAGGMLGPHDFIYWVLPLVMLLVMVAFTVKVLWVRMANSLLAIPMNVFIPLYIGLPLALGLQVLQVDRLYFLLVLLSVWMLDSVAFFVGRSLGRHKMAPGISPKKSWEGAVGGFLACILLGVGLKALELAQGGDMPLTWGETVFVGGLIGITGQMGDLAESLIKRDAGVKDSGGMFAGHGGVLDRLDSVLFSFAAFYVFLAVERKLPVVFHAAPL